MWGKAICGEFLYIPVKFYFKPKTALKKEKDLQKKFNTQVDTFGKTFHFYVYIHIIYVCVFVGLWYKMYFYLDQRSLQATVVNYAGK